MSKKKEKIRLRDFVCPLCGKQDSAVTSNIRYCQMNVYVMDDKICHSECWNDYGCDCDSAVDDEILMGIDCLTSAEVGQVGHLG